MEIISTINMFFAVYIVFFLISYPLIVDKTLPTSYLYFAAISSILFGLTIILRLSSFAYYIGLVIDLFLFGWIISIRIAKWYSERDLFFILQMVVSFFYGISTTILLMNYEDHYIKLVFERKLINKICNFDYDEIFAGSYIPSLVLTCAVLFIVLTYFYSLFFFIQEKQNKKVQ